MKSFNTTAIWLAVVAAVACGEATPSEPPAARAPRSVEKLGGDEQTGTVGSVLAAPLHVRALDGQGRPVPGVAVTWSVAAAAGAVLEAGAVTGADGTAQARWQLGVVAGEAEALASVTGLAPVRFTARAAADLPSEIRLSRDSVVLQVIGDTARVIASVTDRHGNAVSEAGLAWTTSDAGVVAVAGGLVQAVGAGSALITARHAATGTSAHATAHVRLPAVDDSTWLAFVAGEDFACGIAPDARVWCWGDNTNGAVGAGSDEWSYDELVPVASPARFAQLDAGEDNICGVALDGSVYCWGKGRDGQLGDGASVQRNAPVRVQGARTYASVTAAPLHACALTATGAAYCWGANGEGQLGDGTTQRRPVPVAVAAEFTFAKVSAGFFHTCALDAAGRAWCWGANHRGQLGNGTVDPTLRPVAVAGGLAFSDISAGPVHTCAVGRTDGAIHCWGSNLQGELGVATGECSPESPGACATAPVAVASAERFTAVSAGGLFGGTFTCALAVDGIAQCWGGADEGTPPPAPVSTAITFTAVGAGAVGACGLDAGGTAWCWDMRVPAQLRQPERVQMRR